ncbi:TPA_asm: P3 [Hibiscus gammacytorhabdovirus 1]|nr:TPA_asm: P3 [Hibiscus gammacytorhabdovirus 1]
MRIQGSSEYLFAIPVKHSSISDEECKEEKLVKKDLGLKMLFRSLFPKRSKKYCVVKMMHLTWCPTVAHLLSSTTMIVRIRDTRILPSMEEGESDLLALHQRADLAWTLKMPFVISFPTKELASGFPLSLSIELTPCAISNEAEIGTISLSLTTMSSDTVVVTSLGEVSFKEIGNPKLDLGAIVWKGKRSENTKAAILEKYCAGEINALEACRDLAADYLKK